jgi:hypothetical protein
MLGKTPLSMPMVKYWRTKEMVAAKVTTGKHGNIVMDMEGEDEQFPGYPRGHVLFGKLSKLKHEVKNQVFNETYAMLEQDYAHQDIINHIKQVLTGRLDQYLEPLRFDMLPPEKLAPPVREIWRTLSKLEEKEPKIRFLKEYICLLLQEDDSYRWRLQWMCSLFWWIQPSDIPLALRELENAEVIGDMKGFARLWRTVIIFALTDAKINYLYRQFCKEVDWKKLKLTRADKYHFRGKYFKVDWLLFEY